MNLLMLHGLSKQALSYDVTIESLIAQLKTINMHGAARNLTTKNRDTPIDIASLQSFISFISNNTMLVRQIIWVNLHGFVIATWYGVVRRHDELTMAFMSNDIVNLEITIHNDITGKENIHLEGVSDIQASMRFIGSFINTFMKK